MTRKKFFELSFYNLENNIFKQSHIGLPNKIFRKDTKLGFIVEIFLRN